MIQDARAFDQQFVPKELHHREGAIDALTSALAPLADGSNGEDVILTGPSGVGKTTLAKYTCERLEGEAFGVNWGYVNCMSESSRTGALFELTRSGNLAMDLRMEGTPSRLFLQRLRDFDGQFVAVVDEVDILDDQSVLQSLYEIPHVSMVLVCVDEDTLFRDLDQRVASRLRSARSVTLERYSHAELVDILDDRVEVGFREGSVKPKVVEGVADVAAGDARLGISLLRHAAQRCLDADRETVGLDDVVAVADDARAEIATRYVETLSTHQRLLHEIIREQGEVSASTLHELYEEQASEVRAKSTRREYLRAMEEAGVVQSRGKGKGIRYNCDSYG
ncbi:Cdc6/Cdc18 family protein [Haloarchaeobius sp. DFWS5]|uniref:Cdc6/Cdc18 family protein n=1 Tax=Haloarchaeobius sp. DFWS5 TaxID=3446114 RepID=UPI003EC07CED